MHMSMQPNSGSNAHIAPRLARTLAHLAIATGMALLAARAAHAADSASCAPMHKAQTAMMHTSFRETITTGSHPPRQMIVTPTAIYMKTPTGWISAAATPATRARFSHLLGNSLTNCRLLRTEHVDGQSADVYSITSRSASGKDSLITIWLSRSSHLPIRSESDVHRLFGGTRHVSARLEYENVHAPANAKREFDLNTMREQH